jgi:hypothetical protein
MGRELGEGRLGRMTPPYYGHNRGGRRRGTRRGTSKCTRSLGGAPEESLHLLWKIFFLFENAEIILL